MFPYWLLFSVFAAGALQTRRVEAENSRATPLLVLAALFAALMVGLRFETGGDWANYEGIFEYMRFLSLDRAIGVGSSDPGYSLLNWAAHQFGWGIWFVNLACAAIFLWGITRFAAQQPNPWLVFVVAVPYLIIVVGMGYTRQAVAIGLILLAFVAFSRGSFVRFLVYMALAATFHKSAVIVLPLAGIAVTRNRFLIVGFVLFFSVILYSFFLADRADIMSRNYIDAQLQSEGAAVRVAMNVLPAMIFLLFSRRFGFAEHERLLWRNMSLAGLVAVAGLFLLPSSTVVDRLALYLVPLQLVILGRLPRAFPDKGNTNALLVLLVIGYSALIQLVWLNFATHARLWVPYHFYEFGYEAGALY